MAHPDPDHERILEGDALRGVERDYRDLVLSLKALAALLRDEPAQADAVLPRILEAELNQLSVLVGEVCTALKVEERGPRLKPLDLSSALRQAARRAGVRALVRIGQPVIVEADPEVVSQAIQSALALAVRIAEGAVTAGVERGPAGAEIVISLPTDGRAPGTRQREARISMLRRLLAAEGGRLTTRRDGSSLTIRMWFPYAGDDRAAIG